MLCCGEVEQYVPLRTPDSYNLVQIRQPDDSKRTMLVPITTESDNDVLRQQMSIYLSGKDCLELYKRNR
jgi:hypothetical protein